MDGVRQVAYILFCLAAVMIAASLLPGFNADVTTRFVRYLALGPIAVGLAVLILK
jgi:hypothetical protein